MAKIFAQTKLTYWSHVWAVYRETSFQKPLYELGDFKLI